MAFIPFSFLIFLLLFLALRGCKFVIGVFVRTDSPTKILEVKAVSKSFVTVNDDNKYDTGMRITSECKVEVDGNLVMSYDDSTCKITYGYGTKHQYKSKSPNSIDVSSELIAPHLV